jgi:cytochrome c biogenesis protein CcmG, thiol:disulfide interchange protein DsbE
MMMVSLGIGTVVAVTLIIVVSIFTGAPVTNGSTQPTNAMVGKHVDSFSIAGLDGGTITAPWKSGHAAVLIFFASWCPPCQGEMPKVAAYLRHHNEGSIRVIGMDSHDKTAPAKAFVKKSGVAFPVAFDPNLTVATLFNLEAIPDTAFVNAKGVVTQIYLGAIPKSTLAKGIATLRAS